MTRWEAFADRRRSVVGHRSAVSRLLSPVSRLPSHVLVVLLTILGTAVALAQQVKDEPLQARWEQRVEPVRTIALSPDGDRLLHLAWNGQLTCVDDHGRVVWKRPVEGVSRLVSGPGARLVAAYWPDNPLHPEVRLLGPGGELVRVLDAGGPVALGGVAISPDGRRVAVGSAAAAVLMLTLSGPKSQELRLRVPAPVVQLFFGRAGEIYFVTASPAGVGRITPDGKRAWYAAGPRDAEYLASAAPNGTGIAVAERRRTAPRIGTLHLWNRAGTELWHHALDGWPIVVRASHNAERILVALERQTRVGTTSRSDRLLVCYGADGGQLWEKGGPFFGDPLFVAMAQTGEWVVSLGRFSKFYLLRDQGKVWWRHSSTSPVRIATGSADGSSVGVAFADGRLAWLPIPRTPQ